MRRMDMETILLSVFMAAVGAFGLIAGLAAFAGVRFSDCDGGMLVCGACTLAAILWGVLICLCRHNAQRAVELERE